VQELLSNPIIQSSAAPFIVGLVLAAAFYPLKLSGLAAAGGFLGTVYLVGDFALQPLTAVRKVILLGALAPVLGVIADLAFKPTRMTGVVLGTIFGLASLWVFWTVLAQKPPARELLYGGGIAAFVIWTVAFTVSLENDAVRAGAASLFLGLGAGVGAVIGASASLGQYGMALGAASGAFLLLVMILGKRVEAGTTLTLSASVISALLAAGAMLLAQLPWTSVAALALVPILVRLPLGDKLPVWLQAIVASLYALVAAAAAWALAYLASRGIAI
jgi:hypothetical protein